MQWSDNNNNTVKLIYLHGYVRPWSVICNGREVVRSDSYSEAVGEYNNTIAKFTTASLAVKSAERVKQFWREVKTIRLTSDEIVYA